MALVWCMHDYQAVFTCCDLVLYFAMDIKWAHLYLRRFKTHSVSLFTIAALTGRSMVKIMLGELVMA